jgi:hypothetical protein
MPPLSESLARSRQRRVAAIGLLVVHSVRAVRDDVDAGVPKPSPNDVNYLSAVCGSPTGTRS